MVETQLTFDLMNNQGKRKEIKINIPDQERIIDLNGVKVWVKFKIDFFGDAKTFYEGEHYCPHIEVRSFNDKEPNIMTETGYRSCFFDFWVVQESNSFEEMVESVLKYNYEHAEEAAGKKKLKNKPELIITW